jgi:hypothetical protein
VKLTHSIVVALALLFSSCSAMDAVLDYPMSFFDEETGETVEVPLGDLVADNSEGAASVVSNVLGGIHPGLGILGGAAAAAAFGSAKRRKKKVASVESTDSAASAKDKA